MTRDEISSRIAECKKAESVALMNLQMMELLCEVISSASSSLTDTFVARDVYGEDIRAFHEKFELGYNEGPRKLDAEMQAFRIKFLKEELQEYVDAVKMGNLEKQFDALIDLVYVAIGTSYLHGFPFRKGWNRVQLANMSKVLATSAADSTRGYSKDVVKPKGWKAPDLSDLVNPI